MISYGTQAMGNLFHSISAFISGRADQAPVQTTPVEPDTASHGDEVEPKTCNAREHPAAPAREMPLVAYAAPREELPAPRASRSRAVSLLRSAASSPMTSRTVPALHNVAPRTVAHAASPQLTQTERIRLQVMQAQLQLSALHLYEGPIDGHMSPAMAAAVRYFQTLKGFRATGALAAGTLAALGVPLIA
jgi:Putative peptidoglycan binding domain